MKKKLLSILLLAVLPVLAFAGIANAQTFRSGTSTSITAGETIDGSAWVSGSNVDVAGTVNGDLYCAGQTVTISGRVTGDVLCAGQTVTLSGTVEGSARLAGQTVGLSGEVKQGASLAGQTVTLEGSGKIGRDASFFGQSTTINGSVGRDAMIASAAATVNSTVTRNMNAYVDTLTIGRSAVVGGYLTYSGPRKASVDSNAQIAGKVTFNEQKEQQQQQQQQAAGAGIFGAIIWSLMLVVSALIVALLFPRELHTTTEASVAAFPQMLLRTAIGLVAGIVMPFVVVLLMVTVVGIPFSIVLLIAWILIVLLSGSVSAYYTGRIVMRGQTNAILIMLVGAVILAALLLLPVINVIVFLIAVWYGSGAILMKLQNYITAPNYDMRPAPARSRSRS